MSILKQVAADILQAEYQKAGMESGQEQWGTADDFHHNLKKSLGQDEIKPESPFGKIFDNVFKDLKLGDSGEEEIEYSYFIYLNPEQMKAAIEKYGAGDSTAFIECKVPCGHKDRKVRVRQYYTGNEITRSELTTKIQTGEKKKMEYNSEISKENFLSMAWTASSVTSRVRLFIPLLDKDGKKIPKYGHGYLSWELDLYFGPAVDGFHPWAKLELEVKNAKLSDRSIVSVIPLEYDELISSDTSDKEHRKLITSLYNDQYNMIVNDTSFLEGKA